MIASVFVSENCRIAVIEGGVISFIRAHHIGRPVFATNATAAKVWTASYLPFGGVRTSTGTPISARFPGQWFQSESGLHQNWMRDYDPTTGRYIEADPLGLIDGASVYGYVRGNSQGLIDPKGEFGIVSGIAAATASAGLQWAMNYFVGGMSAQNSVKCINLTTLANAAALGSLGLTPFTLYRSGLKRGAGMVFAISSDVNRGFPDLSIGDLLGEQCDCKVSLPEWAQRLKGIIL